LCKVLHSVLMLIFKLKEMKILYILLGSLLFMIACEDLEQFPTNIASSDSLTDFDQVLNAAYYYQHSGVTPMAVSGDFRI